RPRSVMASLRSYTRVIAMDSSTSPESQPTVEARETVVDTVAAQVAAINELIALARQRLHIFDIDFFAAGWHTATRAEKLAAFLRRAPKARVELIAHDLRWLEASCPRILALLKSHSHVITVY